MAVEDVVQSLQQSVSEATTILSSMTETLHGRGYETESDQESLSSMTDLLVSNGYDDIPTVGRFGVPATEIKTIEGVTPVYFTRLDDPMCHYIAVEVGDAENKPVTCKYSNDGTYWAPIANLSIEGSFVQALKLSATSIGIITNGETEKKMHVIEHLKEVESSEYTDLDTMTYYDTFDAFGEVWKHTTGTENYPQYIVGCQLNGSNYVFNIYDSKVTLECATFSDTIFEFTDGELGGYSHATAFPYMGEVILCLNKAYRLIYKRTSEAEDGTFSLTPLNDSSITYGFGYTFGENVYLLDSSNGTLHTVSETATDTTLTGLTCSTDGRWLTQMDFNDDLLVMGPDKKLYKFILQTSSRLPTRDGLVPGKGTHFHFPDVGRSWYSYHVPDMDNVVSTIFKPHNAVRGYYICITDDNNLMNVEIQTGTDVPAKITCKKYDHSTFPDASVEDEELKIDFSGSTLYCCGNTVYLCDSKGVHYEVDPQNCTITKSSNEDTNPPEACKKFFNATPDCYKHHMKIGHPTEDIVTELEMIEGTKTIIHVLHSDDEKMKTIAEKGTITFNDGVDYDAFWKDDNTFVVFSSTTGDYKEYTLTDFDTEKNKTFATAAEFKAACTGTTCNTPTEAKLKADGAIVIAGLNDGGTKLPENVTLDPMLYTTKGVYVAGTDCEYHCGNSGVCDCEYPTVLYSEDNGFPVYFNWDRTTNTVHYSGGPKVTPKVSRGSFRFNAKNHTDETSTIIFPVYIPKDMTWNEIIFDSARVAEKTKSFRVRIHNDAGKLPLSTYEHTIDSANGYIVADSSGTSKASLQKEEIYAIVTQAEADSDFYTVSFTVTTAKELITNAGTDWNNTFVNYTVIGETK